MLQPIRVTVDGEERALPKSRKTRALLAVLALEPRAHTRTALCDWIWSDTADPRAALRWSLTKLRQVLGAEGDSVIVATSNAVSLDVAAVDVDVARLDALLRDPDTTVAALLDVESTVVPGALMDLGVGATAEFELWLQSQQDVVNRLHHQLLSVLIGRLDADPETALALARKRVALDPLRIDANCQLLELTQATQGRKVAQSVLEHMRERLRQAGVEDSELIAAWRRISSPQIRIEAVQPLTPVRSEFVLTLPEKPSVAVLAFDNVSDHPSGDVLAEGLSVDLNSRLAQLQGLFVIARASAMRFSLRTHDPAAIGHGLGVRYLIHGTTQRTDARLRVTVDLIDAQSGAEIWSDRIDRPLDDLFAVQDSIVNAIVAAIEPQIDQAEMERARHLPTENMNAWECYHRAMWHGFRFNAGDNQIAYELLQRALTLDGQFARAYAGLSFNHFSRAFLNASSDIDVDIRQALELASRSLSFDGRDAMGHWALGRGLFLAKEHDQALSAIDRALDANPNFAQGHYAKGFIGAHSGVAGAAIADLDVSRRLSPFDPLLFAMKSSRAICLAVEGDADAAATWAVRATHEPNAHFHIFAVAAACLQLAGRGDDAGRNVAHVLERHPRYTIDVFERSFPHKLESHRRLMSEALAGAGMPAGTVKGR